MDVSGDGRAAGHFRQRNSCAIQRVNAASLLSSLKSIDEEFEEVLVLYVWNLSPHKNQVDFM